MKSKKQSTLKQLMVYAGKYRYFTYASCILAAISAAIALIPFYDIWRIIREVLEVRPDFPRQYILNLTAGRQLFLHLHQ